MPGGVLTTSEKIEFGRRLVLTGKVGCWMRRKSRGHRREQQNKKWAFPDPLSITSSPSHQIRVFIADSHEVVRAGVCKLLEGGRDLEIVGEADNAKGVLSKSGRTKPDVVTGIRPLSWIGVQHLQDSL